MRQVQHSAHFFLRELQEPIQLDRALKLAKKALIQGDVVIDGTDAPPPKSEEIAWVAVLKHFSKSGVSGKITFQGLSPEWIEQLSSVGDLTPPAQKKEGQGYFESLGTKFMELRNELTHLAYLFTESVYWSTLGRFEKIGRQAGNGIGLQLIRLGGDALPIVLILSFLIGLTLAFQSAVQLEPLGASVYLARGIGISMFSEIAPLITAIILAGRSGASITAEIASMVVLEEIKALRTMGIHPVRFLVIPRFQAMSIAVPLLTYLSALAGIFAGLLIALFYAKLPASLFFSELQGGVPLNLLWQCGVKAIVFGWIITLVAVQKGLSVRGGADAVGKATTSCVVFSISAIILTDAIFSFLFYW